MVIKTEVKKLKRKMKLNISLMKLIIRLLILLILIVMLFIISAFLYSAKYWPDVYNYINANITIERIPKISEIEVIIYDETTEGTTDFYETTDMTTNWDDDYLSFDIIESARKKRNIFIEETNDLELKSKIVDYVFDIDDTMTMNDLVDETKLTTADMEDVEILPGILSQEYINNIAENCTANGNISQLLFPWVAAIFIKNETTLQFDYYCDGVAVSNNIVVTAARCLQYYGKWAKPEDILVLFDKTSLITMNEKERAVKVNNTIIHENFTATDNDLALLVMEESLDHQFPCLGEGGSDDAYTTGWAISGELTLISFDTGKRSDCDETNTFTAFYENDVSVCPSYGGIYVERQTDSSTWYLRGIRSADPTDRGLCVNHNITFTDLTEYLDWIALYIE